MNWKKFDKKQTCTDKGYLLHNRNNTINDTVCRNIEVSLMKIEWSKLIKCSLVKELLIARVIIV